MYCSSLKCPILLKTGKVARAAPSRARCITCGTAPNACSCPIEAVRDAVQQGRTRFDIQTMHTYSLTCPTCPQHKAYVFSRTSRDDFREKGEAIEFVKLSCPQILKKRNDFEQDKASAHDAKKWLIVHGNLQTTASLRGTKTLAKKEATEDALDHK